MRIRFILSSIAVATLCLAAVVGIVLMTNRLADDLRREGGSFAQMVRGAQELIVATEDPAALGYATQVIRNNQNVPIIICDGEDIVSYRNLGGKEEKSAGALRVTLEEMKASGDSLSIDLGGGWHQVLYYGESHLVHYVGYIRLLQFVAIALLLFVGYVFLNRIRHRTRDRLWKGLALETAHQLGTPITALMGWRDLLATGFADTHLVSAEMGKDIERLKAVSERFSHIGSLPSLKASPLNDELREVADYMRSRISHGITVVVDEPDGPICVAHDRTLIQWAVENLCKNAADAIGDSGTITIALRRVAGKAVVDVSDTGKGISRMAQGRIFETGYTTKRRGWGIGLALVKRIVEVYHRGRVFVLESWPGEGTTFRMEFRK